MGVDHEDAGDDDPAVAAVGGDVWFGDEGGERRETDGRLLGVGEGGAIVGVAGQLIVIGGLGGGVRVGGGGGCGGGGHSRKGRTGGGDGAADYHPRKRRRG